jgi:two-component system, OmpR family, response regulator
MPDRNPAHILIVDDDPDIRAILRDCFEADGLVVSEVGTGATMFERLAGGGIDLVTLDLTLGRENSLPLTERIRAKFGVPIVMITGKSDTIDRVVGLEMGADDYIAKPFHLREVIARIRAVLRRGEKVAASRMEGRSERLIFQGWILDIGRRELMRPDQTMLDLTTAEFNLLEALARRPQRVLTRDTIMDLLKGHDWSPYDRSIDTLVSRLRRKIEQDADAPSLIKTIRGVGYLFACEVRNG